MFQFNPINRFNTNQRIFIFCTNLWKSQNIIYIIIRILKYNSCYIHKKKIIPQSEEIDEKIQLIVQNINSFSNAAVIYGPLESSRPLSKH